MINVVVIVKVVKVNGSSSKIMVVDVDMIIIRAWVCVVGSKWISRPLPNLGFKSKNDLGTMVRVQPIGRTRRIAMHNVPPPEAGGTFAHEAHVGPPLPGPRGPSNEVREGLPRQAPSRVRAWPCLGRNSV